MKDVVTPQSARRNSPSIGDISLEFDDYATLLDFEKSAEMQQHAGDNTQPSNATAAAQIPFDQSQMQILPVEQQEAVQGVAMGKSSFERLVAPMVVVTTRHVHSLLQSLITAAQIAVAQHPPCM